MRNLREYHKPDTLEEAVRLLSRDDLRAVPLAGGTELVAAPPPEVDAVVDLNALPLDHVERVDADLWLGGLVRLSALAASPEVQAFAGGVVADAARTAATSLLRNQSTLVGTLLARLHYNELPPLLLVLDAQVTVQRFDGADALPLALLYESLARHTERAVITEIQVPAPPAGARVHRHRVARTPADRPILSVTALTRVAGRGFAEVRLAASGVGPLPRRLATIEIALLDVATERDAVLNAVTPLVNDLALPDDPLASAEYRREVLPVLIRRAVLGE